MWPPCGTLVFCLSVFLIASKLVEAELPNRRASHKFFRASATLSSSTSNEPNSSTSNEPNSSSVVSKDFGRYGGVRLLLRRPYCTLGGPAITRFATERIEIWIDPETNVRYIRIGNSSRTALAAKCQGAFQSGNCLKGHPLNGAPPDCGSLQCPCAVDTSLPVPSMQGGKLRAAQSALVKEVGRLCARRRGTFSVLLLGLNRAVLAAYLQKRCPRRLRIDIVESNRYILDAAHAFMGTKQDEHNSIESADSWQYLIRLNATKKKYDAILTDCYGSDGHIPATCRAPSFMIRLRAALRPGGVSFQDVGFDASKSLLMGYGVAFGKTNVALLGPDDVPLRLTSTNPPDQLIRAVAAPVALRRAANISNRSNDSAPLMPKLNASAQSNSSAAAVNSSSLTDSVQQQVQPSHRAASPDGFNSSAVAAMMKPTSNASA